MADTAIDISAGMQPKAASPAPSTSPADAGSIDLSGGMQSKPEDQPDYANAENQPSDSVGRQVADTTHGIEEGMGAETGKVVSTVAHAIHKAGEAIHKGAGEAIVPKQGMDALDQNNEEHLQSGSQKVGAGIQDVAQWTLLNEAALAGMSYASKLKMMAPLLTHLEKFPKLTSLLTNAIRNYAVTTGQGVAQGEEPGDASTTGAITAGAGAAIEGGAGFAKGTISKVKPTATTIAGETMPKLASQEHGADALAGKVASIGSEPEYAAAQQKGSHQAIKNIARDAAERSINRVNAGRVPTTEEVELKPTVRGNKRLTSGAEEDPTRDYWELKKPDGSVTRAYLEDFDNEEQWKRAAVAAGAKVPKKLPVGDIVPGNNDTDVTALKKKYGIESNPNPQYVGGKPKGVGQVTKVTMEQEKPPKFEPVDAKKAAAGVNSFGDAADRIQETAKPVYKKLDEVSNGEFTAMRGQRNAAKKVLLKPGSMDAWSKAQEKLEEADANIEALFEKHKGDVDPADLKSANLAWRDSKVLEDVHSAVEGSFNGVPENIAKSAGVYRGLSGNKLQLSLGNLLKKTPQAEIERVVGKAGLDNLYRIADLTSTPARNAKFGSSVSNIALEMMPKRGFIGMTADEVRKLALHKIATNPRAGQMVENAIKTGANPKVYAPLIAATIRDDKEQQ